MQTNSSILLFAAGGAILLLDQWSKAMAQTHAADRCISVGPLLQIRHVAHVKEIYRRTGPRAMFVLVWLAALSSSILLHRSGMWFQSTSALFGLTSALAGAGGNLLDILVRRHVVDFIDLGWWPVFNLADVGIVAGLAVALWYGV
jgi:signal peptidase II